MANSHSGSTGREGFGAAVAVIVNYLLLLPLMCPRPCLTARSAGEGSLLAHSWAKGK